MTTTDTATMLDHYGVRYEGEQGVYQPTSATMTLGELAKAGGRIVRVRFIGGDCIPGRGRCYDSSYVHGELKDGTRVRVTGLWASLTPRHKINAELIRWAKDEKVYAKGLGLLDPGNLSILG